MPVRPMLATVLVLLFASVAFAEGGGSSDSGLWLVRLEQGADWVEGQPDEAQPHAEETREVMKDLIKRGIVVLAGRSEGAGILVLRSVDQETAQSFLRTLPTVSNDVHRYRLSPFELLHAGNLTQLAHAAR